MIQVDPLEVSPEADEALEALLAIVSARASAALSALFGSGSYHPPVVAVATNNVFLTSLAPIDGVPLIDGSRVFVAANTNPVENGIWLAHAGAWTRAPDWATGSTRVAGEKINVAQFGSTFGRFGDTWQVTTQGIVDSTPIAAFPRFDKGTVALGGGTSTQNDRWIFTGGEATANDTTAGAASAVNIQAVTPGAGNGVLTMSGNPLGAPVIRFVIVNF